MQHSDTLSSQNRTLQQVTGVNELSVASRLETFEHGMSAQRRGFCARQEMANGARRDVSSIASSLRRQAQHRIAEHP